MPVFTKTVKVYPGYKKWIKERQHDLATRHTSTWLATFITLWAIGVIILVWFLVAQNIKHINWILAGILLYEVLP